MSIFFTEVNHLPAGSPDVFRRLLMNLGRMHDRLKVAIPNFDQGFIDEPLNQGTTAAQINIPPPCQFNVVGVDGKYKITITLPQNVNPPTVALMQATTQNNPNAMGTGMVHQLQSATDVLFNAASNVTTFGPSGQLGLEITDPNQTKFWRLQSSFDGQNFNAWQIFQSAAVCGPAGVMSGFLRSTSAAPREVTNFSNNSTVDSVDNGDGTDTIRIYGAGGVGSSFTLFDGQGGQQTVTGGSIGGAAQSTFYQVMWSKAAGFQAFQNATQYTNSLPDALVLISGSLKTVAAGGGGGVNGGGGTSGGGGGAGGGGNKLPKL